MEAFLVLWTNYIFSVYLILPFIARLGLHPHPLIRYVELMWTSFLSPPPPNLSWKRALDWGIKLFLILLQKYLWWNSRVSRSPSTQSEVKQSGSSVTTTWRERPFTRSNGTRTIRSSIGMYVPRSTDAILWPFQVCTNAIQLLPIIGSFLKKNLPLIHSTCLASPLM